MLGNCNKFVLSGNISPWHGFCRARGLQGENQGNIPWYCPMEVSFPWHGFCRVGIGHGVCRERLAREYFPGTIVAIVAISLVLPMGYVLLLRYGTPRPVSKGLGRSLGAWAILSLVLPYGYSVRGLIATLG